MDYAPQAGKIPGTKVNLSGIELIMPPLNWRQVKQFSEVVAQLGQKASLEDNMNDALPLIHAALTRNYPDITIEQVGELLDVSNFTEAATALIKISAFRRAEPGEAQAAQAASTSMPSTLASVTQLVGNGTMSTSA